MLSKTRMTAGQAKSGRTIIVVPKKWVRNVDLCSVQRLWEEQENNKAQERKIMTTKQHCCTDEGRTSHTDENIGNMCSKVPVNTGEGDRGCFQTTCRFLIFRQKQKGEKLEYKGKGEGGNWAQDRQGIRMRHNRPSLT